MSKETEIKSILFDNLKNEPKILEEFETIVVTAKLLDYNISYGAFGKGSAKLVLNSKSECVILMNLLSSDNNICLDFSFTDGKLDRICCCKNEMRTDCHKVDHGSNEDAIQKVKEYL